MTAREYENFDVLIESVGDDRLRARVTQSSGGDPPAQTLQLPFNKDQLENLLLKVDPTRTATRRVMTPHAQASADLGSGLYDSLFHDGIGMAWSRCVQGARERHRGVRLRLRLADAPQVAGLPWELLYDRRSNHYLAKSERTPIVRYLDVDNPPEPLRVQGPLRILVVISSPLDLPRLDVEQEWQRVSAVLADRASAGAVVIDRLPEATLGELQTWLRGNDVHVLHFIGHGTFDPDRQEGVLAFCDNYGHSRAVNSEEIGKYVRDHDPMRLVVLNACQTATTGAVDAYSGIAQGLVQQEAPAVVAMQYPISDGAAIAFAGGFYGALTDGQPVDQAISSVRKTLADDFGDEWMTPVLFLRAANGQIFDQIAAPATAASTSAAPPTAAPDSGADDTSRIEPPPDRTSVPQRRPARVRHRGRWVAIAAIAAVVAAGAVVVVMKLVGGDVVYPIGNTAAPVYTGPSHGAFARVGTVQPHQRVTLICSIYGGAGPRQNFLWYRIGSGYVNDHYVATGTDDPKVNGCTGTSGSPSVGDSPASRRNGPFVVLGSAPVFHDRGGLQPAGRIPNHTLVSITCTAVGKTVRSGGPGRADSAFWDRLDDQRWIPHAELLTGGKSTSLAPACPTTG